MLLDYLLRVHQRPVHAVKALATEGGLFSDWYSETDAECGVKLANIPMNNTTMLFSRVTCPECRKAMNRPR